MAAVTFLWPEDIVKASIATETDEQLPARPGKKSELVTTALTASWEAPRCD